MRISVVTATWNCAQTVVDCLDSIAAQAWPDIEHVVIDGGSSDGTLEIMQGRSDGIASFVSEPDKGIYDALNKGITRATGDVVGFLHADDLFADPGVLARIAQAFSDPAVQAVYGDLQYVLKQDTNRVVRHWRAGEYSHRRLHWGWMPPHPTLYVRRAWYDRIGGFDTRYRISADYDMILRLFSAEGFRAIYLPVVLVKMRVGGASNRSLENVLRKSREDLDALQRKNVGALRGYGALAWKNLSKFGQFIHCE